VIGHARCEACSEASRSVPQLQLGKNRTIITTTCSGHVDMWRLLVIQGDKGQLQLVQPSEPDDSAVAILAIDRSAPIVILTQMPFALTVRDVIVLQTRTGLVNGP
jgi:hypothetical protein